MINILSYIGMNMHSEVCLWTLLGLLRTIFDATLFRVNANLKQVWQMSMPDELSMSVQRVLRTMISGVMLVQCFTVYIYLASYIVLLYPVFLEERPTLVLPWLLLAAVRKLLCELTSLALGLGTCVLLGPARPPCIKFVIIKLVSIMPAFYTWMLLFNYYHALKIAAAFKSFSAVSGNEDYGLELAIRRRRTKSLLGEDQLRSKLVASLYGDSPIGAVTTNLPKIKISSRIIHSTHASVTEIIKPNVEDALRPHSLISNRISETGSCEDWVGSEVILPRASDRILEQFVLMLLRIKAHLDKEDVQTLNSEIFTSKSLLSSTVPKDDNLNCATIAVDDADTPPQVGSIKENTASYMREYPQIFMKKTADIPRSDTKVSSKSIQARRDSEVSENTKRIRKRSVIVSSKERISLDVEKIVVSRNYKKNNSHQRRMSSQFDQSTSKQEFKKSDDIQFNHSGVTLENNSTIEKATTTSNDVRRLSNNAIKFDVGNRNSIPGPSKMNTKKNLTKLNKKNETIYKEPDSGSGELSDEATEKKQD